MRQVRWLFLLVMAFLVVLVVGVGALGAQERP